VVQHNFRSVILCFLGLQKSTGSEVAIKVIDKLRFPHKEEAVLKNEVSILKVHVVTSCAGGLHNMPPPVQVVTGRWHINCWRRGKLCGDLNSQPKRPGDLDLWPFDLESGVRVTCDVGYLCSLPILVFLGLSVLALGPMSDVRRRQTDRRHNKRKVWIKWL